MSKSLKNFLTVRACLQAEKETPQVRFDISCCFKRRNPHRTIILLLPPRPCTPLIPLPTPTTSPPDQPQRHFFPDDFRLFCCLRRFGADADYRCGAVS